MCETAEERVLVFEKMGQVFVCYAGVSLYSFQKRKVTLYLLRYIIEQNNIYYRVYLFFAVNKERFNYSRKALLDKHLQTVFQHFVCIHTLKQSPQTEPDRLYVFNKHNILVLVFSHINSAVREQSRYISISYYVRHMVRKLLGKRTVLVNRNRAHWRNIRLNQLFMYVVLSFHTSRKAVNTVVYLEDVCR